MAQRQRTEMDAIEIANFLGTQQAGVLSLARENDSYGIPVSFAFDREEQNIYLRLGYGPTSTKRQFVEEVDWASFLAFDDTDAGWKSVLARGHLDELSEDSLDAATIQAIRELSIPYFSVFSEDSQDLEVSILRLTVSELTGIVSGRGG